MLRYKTVLTQKAQQRFSACFLMLSISWWVLRVPFRLCRHSRMEAEEGKARALEQELVPEPRPLAAEGRMVEAAEDRRNRGRKARFFPQGCEQLGLQGLLDFSSGASHLPNPATGAPKGLQKPSTDIFTIIYWRLKCSKLTVNHQFCIAVTFGPV